MTLTDEDVKTIAFVGGRYCWSDALSGLHDGLNAISESEAWEMCAAFDADSVGDHSPFPLLAWESPLYRKLYEFWDGVV